MKLTTIPNTGITCSRFIFGTASLFNAGSAKQRQNLLNAAIDSGFTHFDTAPYYGFGMAERDLASVLKRNPRVTVTTKVGLYSRGGESQSEMAIFLRKAAGRFVGSLSKPIVDFSVLRARTALEGSLRRLGRAQIDIYMLHEPQLDLLHTDEWHRWLEAGVTSGKIGTFGLALTADRLEPFLRAGTPLGPVIQVMDSLENREADILMKYGRPMQITYGYVSTAQNKNSTSIAELLKNAIKRNAQGAIIVSTRRAERLKQYGSILESVA